MTIQNFPVMIKINLFSKIKTITLSVLLALASVFTLAQNYTFSPSDTINVYADCNYYSVFEIDFINQTNAPLSLNWTRISNTLPVCWDISLCDWSKCYAGIPTGGMLPADIPAYDKGFFKLDINPLDYAGTGIVKLFLYDINNPTVGDTVIFTINSCSAGNICTVGISDNANTENLIIVSPNPANDFINIEINDASSAFTSCEVYNIIGKKLMTIAVTNGRVNKVPLNNLSKGIYFVKYQNKSHLSVTKKFYKI